jgi:hypothetical protein
MPISPFVAPAMHHSAGAARPAADGGDTAAGHLLECAAWASGGVGDPGGKDARLARLGFPLADLTADGAFWISKVDGTGGRVDLATCKEQLLYELHDPAEYITPDCVLDVTDLEMAQDGRDRVRVWGEKIRARRPTRSLSGTTTASSARARSRTPASTRSRRRSGRRRWSSSGSPTAT